MAHTFVLYCIAIYLCWFILSSFLKLTLTSDGLYFLPFLHCHLSLSVHTFFLSKTDCHLWWFILSSFLALQSSSVGSCFLPFWNRLSHLIVYTFSFLALLSIFAGFMLSSFPFLSFSNCQKSHMIQYLAWSVLSFSNSIFFLSSFLTLSTILRPCFLSWPAISL